MWITLIVAIVIFARQGREGKELHELAAHHKKMLASSGAQQDSKPHAPMLNFVTVDEIYEMSLEVLRSVPKEQMEQLPPDKKAIVKRRMNDLIQEERAKQNK